MRLSQLFVKTSKQAPAWEQSKNAILLQRAGFVDKLLAWVYTYLPFGLRTLRKIENIVRQWMNEIWGQEIYMPALTPSSVWEQTWRWDEIDVLFKLQWMRWQDLALGSTHEEVITPLVQKHVKSYKDLPVYVYQIQTKFRNEKRAKSWILRWREFLMKDLYSFHTDVEDLDRYYDIVLQKYLEIYEKMGLEAYVVDASGGDFSDKPSHEFQVLTEAGEDWIWYDPESKTAVNEEDVESLKDLYEVIKEWDEIKEVIKRDSWKSLIKAKASEVGNIFKLYDKFSKAFNFKFIDKDWTQKYVQMWCYGIGVSRLMWVIAEKYSDEKGLKWPQSVAPYMFVIIPIWEKWKQKAEEIYRYLQNKYGDEVVLDDRQESPGFKFKDADLIGYPYQIVVSDKTLEQGENIVELVDRMTGEKRLVDFKEIKDVNVF